MALFIVGDTISEIMEKMSFLPVFQSDPNMTESVKKHLLTIRGVVVAKLELNDGETRTWVEQVRDVVSDLWDLVEDLDLPPADAAALLPKHNKITSFFSSFCKVPLLRFHKTLLQLKEIQERLQRLAAEAHAIKFSPSNLEIFPYWDDAEEHEMEIFGRDDEKEKIMQRIFPVEKLKGIVKAVIIAGIEGIGKTKLAKYVFNDEKVKSEFGLRVWIDGIHDKIDADLTDFVVKRVKESIKEYHKGCAESMIMDESVLHFGRSRFFVVLDDLRNENREELLRLDGALKEATSTEEEAGGVLLITTRSDIIGGAYKLYPYPLNDFESLSLFKQITGECPTDSKIKEAQEEMVEMCRGVPAAIETMARLVRSREATTESQIYELKDEFMHQMLLRYYNNLPSWQMRKCFAYSSFIFSFNSVCNFKKLIRLWMAEGFLGHVNSCSLHHQEPEELGFEFIQEFRRRSIYESIRELDGRWVVRSPHRLMQDLSKFLSSEDCLYMKAIDEHIKERVRRVSLLPYLYASTGIPKSLFKIKRNLYAIHFPKPSRVPNEVILGWSACEAIFSSFQRLHVLTLQNVGMKNLPASIGKMKCLRYLKLCHNSMRELPNSICELKHLQTLSLSHCHQLRELPNNFNHLVSLRHLKLKGCLHLMCMPPALNKLTCLHTLPFYVASTTNNGGIESLIHLNNLRGKLEISHLERLELSECDQSGNGYLKEKKYLQYLTLRWNHEDEVEEVIESQTTEKHISNSINRSDQISLGYLEPHPNLRILSIIGYEGNQISNWLSSLNNLVEFSLYNCSKCKKLPPLDQLPNLTRLRLDRLDSLEFITEDDPRDAADTKSFFRSLRNLGISDCPKLISWWKGKANNNNAWFPSLSKLKVQYCPKLDCIPLYPYLDDELTLVCSSLKPLVETINYKTSSDSDFCHPLSKLEHLTIENVEEEEEASHLFEVNWLKNFTSLKTLRLRECKGFKSLLKGFKHLNSLEELHIRNWKEVDLSSAEWKGLKKLRILHISEMPKLESLPEEIKQLSSLGYLWIESCPGLVALTDSIGELKSLGQLYIEECHKLASLPQGLSNLTDLWWLSITNCPLLLPRCQKETGDDWPQIKHIFHIILKDTTGNYD